MHTKQEIVENWLPRYTKRSLEDFGDYILLTNFTKYVELFSEICNVPVIGHDSNMPSASAQGITMKMQHQRSVIRECDRAFMWACRDEKWHYR